MNYKFKATNTTLTDTLKDTIIKKFGKLEKLLPADTNVTVTLSVIKIDHKIEVTILLPKRILRAEVTSHDMYYGVDEILDKLEKQLVKYKNRLRDKSRRDTKFMLELRDIAYKDEIEDEEAIIINKTKTFDVKPMDSEEAILEMELLSHNFFVFKNSSNNSINVIYRRNDGTYGLIDPEY